MNADSDSLYTRMTARDRYGILCARRGCTYKALWWKRVRIDGLDELVARCSLHKDEEGERQ